ncbi:hypothetical protein BZA70DRAFT_14699 [Myxozyma melibiosi]|uniref:Nab2 type CCCH zinc finger 4 domain-containing protein n=1 Tax=Myxozyma melibiosi TaxID=54550 RepID=A0ABR1FC75_9ASCO
MSSIALTAGSPLAETLQASVGERLRADGFAEDETPFISEFVVIMICNNKGPEQISSELTDLLGANRFSGDFIGWLFDELRRLAGGESGQQQQQQQQEVAPANEQGGSRLTDAINVDLSKAPSAPAAIRNSANGGQVRKGRDLRSVMHGVRGNQFSINKGGQTRQQFNNMRGRGANNFMNNEMYNRMNMNYNQNHNNNSNSNINNFNGMYQNNGYQDMGMPPAQQQTAAQAVTLSRCRHWPYHDSICKFPHPMAICEHYPNCPNMRGTCPKIHVGEDMTAEDAQKYIESNGTYEFTPLYEMGNQMYARLRAQKKAEMMRMAQENELRQQAQLSLQRNHNQQRQRPTSSTTPLCKFALRCTNADCVFVHPTPANGDALVLSAEACPEGTGCTDENCDKAHPSPASMRSAASYTADTQMSDGGFSKPNYLDPCRYGAYCTNPHCKYRHATSTVLCRDGADCTRQDCMFTHPFATPCKYDSKCINPNCIYSHPNGKANLPKTHVWVAAKNGESNEHVSERSFAVGDDEVEKIAQPEAGSSSSAPAEVGA